MSQVSRYTAAPNTAAGNEIKSVLVEIVFHVSSCCATLTYFPKQFSYYLHDNRFPKWFIYITEVNTTRVSIYNILGYTCLN